MTSLKSSMIAISGTPSCPLASLLLSRYISAWRRKLQTADADPKTKQDVTDMEEVSNRGDSLLPAQFKRDSDDEKAHYINGPIIQRGLISLSTLESDLCTSDARS